MFLRKLLVIVVPLVLCGLCVFFLPLLGGFGLWSDLLQGADSRRTAGAAAAAFRRIPPQGAVRDAARCADDCADCPAGTAAHARTRRGAAVPAVSGCTMMIECTFLSFMTVQAIRTKT